MHLPPVNGDIRHQQLHMLPVDITNLWTNEYLNTNLIDFLLQNTLGSVASNTESLFVGPSLFPTGIAATEYDILLEARDTSRRTRAANVCRVNRRKQQLQRFAKQPSVFVAAVIELEHFFVLYVETDHSLPQLYKEICCYDSFVQDDTPPSEKALAKKIKALDVMQSVDKWLRHYIYADHLPLSFDFEHLIVYHNCPKQYNGWDCGLFTLGVVLHLALGLPVHKTIFNSEDVACLHTQLADIGLCNKQDTAKIATQVLTILSAYNIGISGSTAVVKQKSRVSHPKRLTHRTHRRNHNYC